MNMELLNVLKLEAKKVLDENTRFHDYAHALEVLSNLDLLLAKQPELEVNLDSVYAAILFHDTSDSSDKDKEGPESSSIATRILEQMESFPKDKISEVRRLILSINSSNIFLHDEILINTADEMAAFSDLGILRSFMIYGSRGLKVREAIEDELKYLEKRFNKLRLETAKGLVTANYQNKQNLLNQCLKVYS